MLLIFLALLIFSILKFYFIWEVNYRPPDGVFYFEEQKMEQFKCKPSESSQ